MEKADASYIQELNVEMFQLQEQLARLHGRLEDRHQTKAQAEAKHRQVQAQLETQKSQFSTATNRDRQAKASGESFQLVVLPRC